MRSLIAGTVSVIILALAPTVGQAETCTRSYWNKTDENIKIHWKLADVENAVWKKSGWVKPGGKTDVLTLTRGARYHFYIEYEYSGMKDLKLKGVTAAGHVEMDFVKETRLVSKRRFVNGKWVVEAPLKVITSLVPHK